MKILVYSETSTRSLRANLGAPEYSYFFVLQAFLPALRRIGEVHIVDEPHSDVDPIFNDCRRRGEPCVFLSFSPPHRTLTTLACPTVPVFAWEFDDIPCESWAGDRQSNWQDVLASMPGAIVHSRQTADAVKRAMGNDYPVGIVPAPIWSRVEASVDAALGETGDLEFEGYAFDSRRADWRRIADDMHWHRKEDRVWLVARNPQPRLTLTRATPSSASAPGRHFSRRDVVKKHLLAFYAEVVADLVPTGLATVAARLAGRRSALPTESSLAASGDPEPVIPDKIAGLVQSGAQRLRLDGVVYCAVLNPDDGRKNIKDMLSAFCEAFRDCPDATLLVKLTQAKAERALSKVIAELYRSVPFECRVVLLAGYLDDDAYRKMITLTSYTVNTSHGEGQCLPLMEFMSAGKPAVAPNSSAMADYINRENAFVVASSREMTSWPQDPRSAYRTFRYRIDFDSLVTAFKTSYLARKDDQRYLSLSRAARSTLRDHCSDEIVVEKLMNFLNGIGTASAPPSGAGNVGNDGLATAVPFQGLGT